MGKVIDEITVNTTPSVISEPYATVDATGIGAKQWDRRDNLLPPWKPGQSGNPAGRKPKALTITSLLKDKLDTIDPLTKETYAQGIVKAMLKQALKDPQVLKELLNRCEGKVTDTIDMQTAGVSILYELVKPKE